MNTRAALVPLAAADAALSTEELLHLEQSGLLPREIRRLLFVRWLRTLGRLPS
jgi:hypothetical protein